MTNNKQSSVDFYRIESQKLIIKTLRNEITRKEWVLLENKLGEQAKAMHKEEIKEALIDGAINAGCIEYRILHYYNETFGGKNEQQ